MSASKNLQDSAFKYFSSSDINGSVLMFIKYPLYIMKQYKTHTGSYTSIGCQLASSPQHFALKLAGFAAATIFLVVSGLANLRFGLSLGNTELDRAIYAAASVASDVLKALLPLLVLLLWSRRYGVMALAALILWTGCVAWSLASAIGFAASSRDETVATRQADTDARQGWEAKVERAEGRLDVLSRHRPASMIQTEIGQHKVSAHIWRRTKNCTDITIEASRFACDPVLNLRAELAEAKEAERIEQGLVAARNKLATLLVAGEAADPQAAMLARISGADEVTIRTTLAIVIALLIEAGSALGFTIVTLATGSPAPVADRKPVRSRPRLTAKFKPPIEIPADPPSLIEIWAAHRIDNAPEESIPALEAYQDFKSWCEQHGHASLTMSKFGRDFTQLVERLGGRKEKRRDRSYYLGFALIDGRSITQMMVAA